MTRTRTMLALLGSLLSVANMGIAGCGVSHHEGTDEGVTTRSSKLASAGCADGSAEESFSGGLLGCAGAVVWDNRRTLCGVGYRPATAVEWVALRGGRTPEHNYWTDDDLHFDGSGPSACRVSTKAGPPCNAGNPMRVCRTSGIDAEGNSCNWSNCGLNNNTPNDFFGGCANNTAGTLCVPDGCADGTVEQTFPNGMLGCGGSVLSPSAAAPLCAPGYRLATVDEFSTLTRPEIRVSLQATASRKYWTKTVRVCPLFGCTGGPTAGAVCVPQRGCADGSAEQVMTDGFVGCGGRVTWADRDSLCAVGYRVATAAEWRTINQLGPSITPTYIYWTADILKWTGPLSNCSVSATVGGDCVPGQPMRICTASPDGRDPEGNHCTWTHCGLDTHSPNLYFGGCATTTAGTLCVPSDIAPTAIVQEIEPPPPAGTPPLLQLLKDARAMYPETPALAAAIVVDGRITMAAVGKRKHGDTGDTLQATDKFPLESVSKVFAGAVIARAVDQRALDWSSTIGGALSSIFEGLSVDARHQSVTLAELNGHAGGLDYDTQARWNEPITDADSDYVNLISTTERKRLYARDHILDLPLYTHGDGSIYGNGESVVAISMLELQTGRTPFELLLEDYLFRPLGMKRSGTVGDVWRHHLNFAPNGSTSLAPSEPSFDYVGSLRVPPSGIAASIEDVARFLHATLYSPRAPWHLWSERTQEPMRYNVGRGGWSAGGWDLNMNNRAGGLELWKNGCAGYSKSLVVLWPTRGVGMALLTNIGQDHCGARALDWAYGQMPALLGGYGVPTAVFPHQSAPTHGLAEPDVWASSVYSAGYEASKAFDGDYSTFWAAEGGKTTGTTLIVSLPASPVGHVLINEAGTNDATSGATSRHSPDRVQEFRITSWQLFLTSGGTESLAAQGTTLGVNKLIPVSGYSGVTAARLVMDSTDGPTIKEMHLLPW